uniref:Uncharacterized protein n=1 Tax=Meloidogyne incognita TaxID=6306 RepID=A0A914MYV7_MELIC
MDHVLINENISLESSNPNQNYQQPNWDAPPGFTSHSRATAQTGAQRGSANVVPHTTTARQYSNLLQQNVQPVILAPRQDIQSSSRSIRTLYEGQERASNFDFFANGGEIQFGGQSDGANNNMISFTQHDVPIAAQPISAVPHYPSGSRNIGREHNRRRGGRARGNRNSRGQGIQILESNPIEPPQQGPPNPHQNLQLAAPPGFAQLYGINAPIQQQPPSYILTQTQHDGQQTGRYGNLISTDPNVPGYTLPNRPHNGQQ